MDQAQVRKFQPGFYRNGFFSISPVGKVSRGDLVLRRGFENTDWARGRRMKLRGTGRSLIGTGVVCVIVYVLLSLYGLSATGLRIGTFLLYLGIVMIIIGIAVRLSRTSPRA